MNVLLTLLKHYQYLHRDIQIPIIYYWPGPLGGFDLNGILQKKTDIAVHIYGRKMYEVLFVTMVTIHYKRVLNFLICHCKVANDNSFLVLYPKADIIENRLLQCCQIMPSLNKFILDLMAFYLLLKR